MTGTLAPVFAVLGDETRWSILTELGREDLSASSLAARLPISRQAISKHLGALAEAGLVHPGRVGREVRYRALGSRLSELAAELDRIGTAWELRLDAIRRISERTI